MRLFLPPIRPLTNTGQVLLCAATAVLACVLSLVWSPAQANDSDAVKPESPYFFVNSNDPGTDRLPLKSTDVNP